MSHVQKLWPLLTATHRYDKSISTFKRGMGQMIDAPILAYLIETSNGRILYDVGCDHAKIHDPVARARYYNPEVFEFGAPDMRDEQRIPHHLARLGLSPADVDLIFIGHLHFDHAGGLKDLRRCGCGAEIHVQHDELARSGADGVVFADDLVDDSGHPIPFTTRQGEYTVVPGVHAVSTPGHTVGHMSMLIEMPKGPPILLAGDAADLQENIDDEVAPGTLWLGREQQAIDSIRKLKAVARDTGAWIWPNHDLAFYRTLPAFPGACE
ncbi:MAG: MBL fold metallo-hydrolase [Leptothrix sp. (in: Bacteria)]|nr:MBL fold metallo-hydrolase [Leptothrix sp. (in: b-proteobacteria)]